MRGKTAKWGNRQIVAPERDERRGEQARPQTAEDRGDDDGDDQDDQQGTLREGGRDRYAHKQGAHAQEGRHQVERPARPSGQERTVRVANKTIQYFLHRAALPALGGEPPLRPPFFSLFRLLRPLGFACDTNDWSLHASRDITATSAVSRFLDVVTTDCLQPHLG
ncbi:MAG: hypothetical protein P8Y25_06835 [Chromatiaceae bacterium]